jgi:hypothetical protein
VVIGKIPVPQGRLLFRVTGAKQTLKVVLVPDQKIYQKPGLH